MGVVEGDDVMSDVGNGLGRIGVAALPDPFPLQAQEEPLHDGVIPAVSLATGPGLSDSRSR